MLIIVRLWISFKFNGPLHVFHKVLHVHFFSHVSVGAYIFFLIKSFVPSWVFFFFFPSWFLNEVQDISFFSSK